MLPGQPRYHPPQRPDHSRAAVHPSVGAVSADSSCLGKPGLVGSLVIQHPRRRRRRRRSWPWPRRSVVCHAHPCLSAGDTWRCSHAAGAPLGGRDRSAGGGNRSSAGAAAGPVRWWVAGHPAHGNTHGPAPGASAYCAAGGGSAVGELERQRQRLSVGGGASAGPADRQACDQRGWTQSADQLPCAGFADAADSPPGSASAGERAPAGLCPAPAATGRGTAARGYGGGQHGAAQPQLHQRQRSAGDDDPAQRSCPGCPDGARPDGRLWLRFCG